MIDKLVYTATNPVQDHLVDRVHNWLNGLNALLAGRSLRATRLLHFFRARCPMPDTLELPLSIPTELGPTAEVLSELRDRMRAVELEREAKRARTGRRVLGRRAVLAQSWRESYGFALYWAISRVTRLRVADLTTSRRHRAVVSAG